jgi:hypothetical protein
LLQWTDFAPFFETISDEEKRYGFFQQDSANGHGTIAVWLPHIINFFGQKIWLCIVVFSFTKSDAMGLISAETFSDTAYIYICIYIYKN